MYSTIMVHVEPDQPNQASLAVAGDLAEKFSARVIGVAACDLNSSAYFAAGAYAAQLIEQSRDVLRGRLAEAEKTFRAALQGRTKDLEWRSALEFPTSFVTREARAADLIVTGAGEENLLADPFASLDTGALLMQAGRPMLLVPAAMQWLDLRSVLVAWKDTREARRAVYDALPLLKLAKNVTVAEILENDGDRSAAMARVSDVVAWLTRHSVQASANVPTTGGEAGGRLEAVASDVGASVIVAGGYGHARLREWAFGGVTRSLLANARLCSLMSH